MYGQEGMYCSHNFLSHGTRAMTAVSVSALWWMWVCEEMVRWEHCLLSSASSEVQVARRSAHVSWIQTLQKFGGSLCWRILLGNKSCWISIQNPRHGATAYAYLVPWTFSSLCGSFWKGECVCVCVCYWCSLRKLDCRFLSSSFTNRCYPSISCPVSTEIDGPVLKRSR